MPSMLQVHPCLSMHTTQLDNKDVIISTPMPPHPRALVFPCSYCTDPCTFDCTVCVRTACCGATPRQELYAVEWVWMKVVAVEKPQPNDDGDSDSDADESTPMVSIA